jgi:hypothetical protein
MAMSDADLVNWLRSCVSRLINGDTVDGDIEVEKLNASADRIEALVAEVERLREICGEAADLIKRQQGWQEYGEKLERSADAEMAAEIQDQRKKNCALRGEIEALMHARAAWKSRAESAERALAEAVEIMRPFARMEAIAVSESDEADYAVHVKSTVENQPQFRHFDAARDFITAQEKEKGKGSS